MAERRPAILAEQDAKRLSEFTVICNDKKEKGKTRHFKDNWLVLEQRRLRKATVRRN